MTDTTQSRQEAFSGTKDVTQNLRFDEAALASYLGAHLPGFAGPLVVRQFKGGQSNPTYLLETPATKYVLRRKPPGKLLPSAHAVDREYTVIKALNQTDMPVPHAYLLCEDETVIGTAFYVMSFESGRILWDPLMPDLAPVERTAIYDAMNATLAKLHMIDPAKIGLAEFGKPGNYFARQITRWTKQYKASETRHIESMERLIEWLPANIPDGDDVSIVHGDFRIDNMVLHATEPRVLAVLDWELSTLGHPLADFSYHLLSWRMPGTGLNNLGLDFKALGIPTEEDYIASYCNRTGRANIPHMDFYMAYNLFRLAGIVQGIAGRVRDGTAASEHAAENEARVQPLADQGWIYAQAAARG
jgi:aminoglycoside phosphotransferase (APT) family kinase protein